MELIDIKGVGKKKLLLLNKLGIFTVNDLLEYLPYDYVDTTKFVKIKEVDRDGLYSFRLKIVKLVENKRIKNLIVTKLLAMDEDGSLCSIVYFNNPFILKTLKIGSIYEMYGKTRIDGVYVEIQVPTLQNKNKLVGKIIPQYHLTSGLSNLDLIKIIRNALDSNIAFEDALGVDISNKFQLISYKNAIKSIHFPENFTFYEEARKRLVFEEFFFFQLQMNKLKESENKAINFEISKEINELIENLPFKLTDSQTKVLEEIFFDMKSKKQMNRLVQGDVGSGKTIVALISAFNVIKNGYQCAFMVPTEILARQHYQSTVELFKDYGINVELLVGSLKVKEKKEIYQKLENGEIDLIIGTHTLFQEKVSFKNLGFIITDEQHRFGVKQRLMLSKKANNPDILVMSATPIPRTVGLVMFCDLDISIISELPKGRGKINTYFVNESYEKRFTEFIRKNINEGKQAYIVCPLVEDSDSLDLQSVKNLYERLKKNYFSDIEIEFLHGKMSVDDKNRIMKDFEENRVKILVSTTVIEVGINVPNANIMVIYNSDRFGLSQLHQLRGRIGRGQYESYCILVSNRQNGLVKKRMEVMCSSTDGFYISEQDFLLRGYGDIFGYRQSGISKFKIADISTDLEIFKDAKIIVDEILEKDFNLSKIEHREIQKKYRRIVEKFKNEIIMN